MGEGPACCDGVRNGQTCQRTLGLSTDSEILWSLSLICPLLWGWLQSRSGERGLWAPVSIFVAGLELASEAS